MKLFFALIGLLAAATVAAQTPTGAWKTVDDATGKEKAVIRITEANGVFTGKIEKLLDPAKQDSKCDECTDDRKGKPVVGLTIMRNVKKGEGHWEGGDILDAANGKVYRVRLSLSADNKKLEVRGYMGTPLFGRTQTWTRME
ncbi:MAG TPA: DUF2147 domain-containing protein [Casimicrobium huifangae]|jgi:uncharacterized protein (DUF2147 family)|uniref:DUF2147 domain-containing protein n=1 Tax=Casimicrobium huifangae TaxID=2591109 RepID=UPI0012EB321F|nr:DUF2147 domain-containing protein [Casimicrobium huifangae]HOB03031.1 DUF2147 domain-containing protein [Casimicrobium huifangae]HQD66243.1 DUF2147 domain-containing protein [Casimicrobium huifangae]